LNYEIRLDHLDLKQLRPMFLCTRSVLTREAKVIEEKSALRAV
jgi:hypothetical protein